MAATVSGYQTSTVAVNPTIPASTLNTIWSTAPQNLTVLQLTTLHNALACRSAGEDPNTVIGTLFT